MNHYDVEFSLYSGGCIALWEGCRISWQMVSINNEDSIHANYLPILKANILHQGSEELDYP